MEKATPDPRGKGANDQQPTPIVPVPVPEHKPELDHKSHQDSEAKLSADRGGSGADTVVAGLIQDDDANQTPSHVLPHGEAIIGTDIINFAVRKFLELKSDSSVTFVDSFGPEPSQELADMLRHKAQTRSTEDKGIMSVLTVAKHEYVLLWMHPLQNQWMAFDTLDREPGAEKRTKNVERRFTSKMTTTLGKCNGKSWIGMLKNQQFHSNVHDCGVGVIVSLFRDLEDGSARHVDMKLWRCIVLCLAMPASGFGQHVDDDPDAVETAKTELPNVFGRADLADPEIGRMVCRWAPENVFVGCVPKLWADLEALHEKSKRHPEGVETAVNQSSISDQSVVTVEDSSKFKSEVDKMLGVLDGIMVWLENKRAAIQAMHDVFKFYLDKAATERDKKVDAVAELGEKLAKASLQVQSASATTKERYQHTLLSRKQKNKTKRVLPAKVNCWRLEAIVGLTQRYLVGVKEGKEKISLEIDELKKMLA